TRACGADFECPVGETCARYLACDGGPNDGRPCTGTADSVAECAAGDGGVDGTCAPTTCTTCDAGPRAGLPCHSQADCAAVGAPTASCVPGMRPCKTDDDCPGAECGPGLFDLSDRLEAGVGPVRVNDVDAVALDPVPLSGLVETDADDRL